MRLRCIIFDMGKVLIDFSFDKAFYQISQLSGVEPTAIRSFLFDDQLEYRFESGEISFLDLHDLFQKKFNCEINAALLANACSDIFEPISGSIALVKELKQNFSGSLILLSNTNEVHWDFITKHWNFHQLFDHHVLSFEVKSMKPDSKIYEAAVKFSGCKPEECLFIDDMAENVAGAQRLGINAVRFSSPLQLHEELGRQGVHVNFTDKAHRSN